MRLPAAFFANLALGPCSKAQQANDSSKRPSLRVGRDAALASGAPDMALRVADLTLTREPRNVRAMIARGDAMYAMGQRNAAEAAYRAAIVIDPSSVGAQVGLGRTLVRTDAHAAEAAFLSALKYDSANITALNNLGIARDMQGRFGDAEDAYYQALASSPGSGEVQVNLGLSLALSGHADEAVRLLRGVAADPAAAQAWRKELTDALTLAGDGPWAQQMLHADPVLADAEVAPAGDRVRFASAPEPSPAGMTAIAATSAEMDSPPPRPAPRVPVAKIDLGSIEATAVAGPTLPARAAVTAPAVAIAKPAPAVVALTRQMAVARTTARRAVRRPGQ